MNPNLTRSRKKIVVDAHIFDSSFQGSASYLHGLYSALVAYEDLEITLCARNIERLRTLFPDPRFRFLPLQTASKIKRLAIEFPSIIKRGKFDYAHFQYITPLSADCKVVNTIHDLLFLDFKNYFPWSYRVVKGGLFKYSAKRSDIILTVSEYSRNALLTKFHLDGNRVFVTPNGVSKTADSEADIKTKYSVDKFILFVSRFEPRKNHLGLLRAYLELDLAAAGYQLVFIGAKNEKIEMDAYQKMLQSVPPALGSKIRCIENISKEELNAFYTQAACFVYPSFAEGFGIPPIEAAVNGCKVACSDQTAMADFDFFKYRFDPNNFTAFKTALRQCLDDDDYPFEEIKKKALEKYDWHTIAADYYAILGSH